MDLFQTGKVSCLFVGGMKFPKRFSCTGCGSKPRLLGMLGMTASFMLVELIVGNLTNSMALVADSFHMLSDVIALVRESRCVNIPKFCAGYCLCQHHNESKGVEQEYIWLGKSRGDYLGCITIPYP